MLEEREEISLGLHRGASLTSIAASIGRSLSTVSREVAANGGRCGYRAWRAHQRAAQRTLRPNEKILVEPGGFLYKDSSVTMNTVKQSLKTGMMGGHNMYLAEMTGPGRVGIQSMYVHHGSE